MATKTIYLEQEVQNWLDNNKGDRSISKFINELVRAKIPDNEPKEVNKTVEPEKEQEVPKVKKEAVKQPKTTNKVWNLKQPVKGLSMKEQINRQRSRNSA